MYREDKARTSGLDLFPELNIKEGMPYVDQALARFSLGLQEARRSGCKGVKVIHGYGSSGRGGKIRTALHALLEQLRISGKIITYIPGDRWSIFDKDTRTVMDIYAPFRTDPDLDRFNRGMTVILLKK